MEFTKLSEELKKPNFEFRSFDYLYLHNKDTYPLQNEVNFENLYFVTEVSGLNLKVISILNDSEIEINFSSTSNNWWFLRLPELIKNKLLNTNK